MNSFPVYGDSVDCDVLVVGGGSAGVVAAIQAGRLNAKTVLVEVGSMLGGQATVGGVNSPILLHREGKQCVRGIGWEWMTRTVNLDNHELPTPETDGRGYRLNASLYAIVAEEMLQEAGVEIRYFEAPSRVEPVSFSEENPFHWTVTTADMGELRTIRCKQIVDATGSGSVCALVVAKRLRGEEIMPGNLQYSIQVSFKNRPSDDTIEACCRDALKTGALLPTDCPRGPLLMLAYQAQSYVSDADSSTAEARTDTNLRARQMVLRVLRFLQSLPGVESARLVAMNPEVGVRETRRVQTEHVVTKEEYCSGKVWDDSICFSAFSVDLHRNEWPPVNAQGWRMNGVKFNDSCFGAGNSDTYG